MQQAELTKVLAYIKANYPNFMTGADEDDTKMALGVWFDYLQEYKSEVVIAAIKTFSINNAAAFAPTPGQLVAEICKLTARVENKPETTAAQAWDMLVEVLRGGLCYYNPNKAFEKLPIAIQKCIGSANTLERWSMASSEQLHDYTRSQFMRDYKDMAAFYREQDALPYSVKTMIGLHNESLMFGNSATDDEGEAA